MGSDDKPLVWLHVEIKTPPLSEEARRFAGFLLRRLQAGEYLEMPHSRPMPVIGPRCHELRIDDENRTWRIVYRIDEDAIVIVDVFAKKTQETPKHRIDTCKDRLADYDSQSLDETLWTTTRKSASKQRAGKSELLPSCWN